METFWYQLTQVHLEERERDSKCMICLQQNNAVSLLITFSLFHSVMMYNKCSVLYITGSLQPPWH